LVNTCNPTQIHVGASEIAGRGVFASEPIRSGEIVEECHILRVPAEQVESLDRTCVYEYYFEWGGDAAIALGNGSICNHSSHPNASYCKDLAAERLVIRAVRPIDAGEEITIDYGAPQVS